MQREADGEAELDGLAWSGSSRYDCVCTWVMRTQRLLVTMVTKTEEEWPHALLGSKAPA